MTVGNIGRAASLVCIATLFSACTTLDPYTREEQTARAQNGAIIGAISGAVVGLVTGDGSMERKKRALAGAGLGALAGGAVGYYQDRQEAKLRAELEGTGVSVTRIGDNITLNMPGNITFATNSADLNADFFAVLDSVSKVLEEFDQTVVEVAGHTDSTGTDAYNRTLSARRAASVGTYIVNRGVIPERIIEVGLGESLPIATNETDTGRQLNRRVELTLVPITMS